MLQIDYGIVSNFSIPFSAGVLWDGEMSEQSLWDRYQAHLVRYKDLGIWLDISRMRSTKHSRG